MAVLSAAAWLLPAGVALAIPAPLELEDRPEPLPARQARTEAQEDRVEAMALFSVGRTCEQRQQFDKALRYYARAQRRDPASGAILEAIVPLAIQQKWYPMAVRYALKVAEAESVRPLLLRRLGVYLTEVGDFSHAIEIYEKVLAARAHDKPDATDVLLWMEMGRLEHLAEHYKKAAERFTRVIDALDHPDKYGLDDRVKKTLLSEPGPTYQLFGECYLRSDRLSEATAAFRKSHALAPNEVLLKYHLAQVAARSGKPEEALTDLQAALDKGLTGEGIAPYDFLAELLKKLGREKELVERLEKLHAILPENIPLGYALASRYCQSGRPDRAETLYTAMLAKAPTTVAFRSLAEIYRKAKRADSLLKLLGEGVEKTGTLEVFGPEAKAISGDVDLVRSLVDAARTRLKADPDKLGYSERLALALVAVENKQYELAGEFFELALKARPKQAAEVLLTWGVSLLLDERNAEAAKVFRRGIDQKVLPENNPAFHFYLAGTLAVSDKTDEALAEARKAADAKKDSSRFASRIPWILYRAKRHAEAIKAYEDLIARFDGDHQSVETREALREARLALSNLCVLMKRFPDAEEWLEQVLDEFPDDVSASNDLGYLWADDGKHLQRALRMTQRAVAAEPDNMAYRDSLGWALFRLGRAEEACVELEKAAADKKPDPLILDHLGDVYLRVGRPDRAKELFRRAAAAYRLEKEDDKAQQMEQKIKTVK